MHCRVAAAEIRTRDRPITDEGFYFTSITAVRAYEVNRVKKN